MKLWARVFPQVTLTVDGMYMEQWKTSGIFSVLASNTVFLGGSEESITKPSSEDKAGGLASSSGGGTAATANINLVGCMRKVNI